MEEKELNKKEKRTLLIVSLAIVIALVFGISYAYFMAVGESSEQTITTANLTMRFTNGDIVHATDISPINDSEIKTKATELPFSITNTGNQHMDTKIKLTDIIIADDLKNIDFRWGLYNADTDIGLSFGFFENIGTKKEITIYEDFIIDAGSESKNYVLRIWIHDDGAIQNEMQGETFSAKVTVTGEAIGYTPESCFTFDSSTGTITYKTMDYENLIFESGYSNECSREVIIPKTIGGVEVKEVYLDNAKALTQALRGAQDDLDMSEALTRVIIPDTVSRISLMFNNLKHLTLPEGVEYGGGPGNPLESISIPETFKNLDFTVGGDNTPLTEITIPGSVKIFEEGSLSMPNLKNVVLSEGNESIYSNVFKNTKIETIEIPSSVTYISTGAFSESPNLQEIVVRGKSSLADFTDSTGLTVDGGLPEGVNIVFRP